MFLLFLGKTIFCFVRYFGRGSIRISIIVGWVGFVVGFFLSCVYFLRGVSVDVCMGFLDFFL